MNATFLSGRLTDKPRLTQSERGMPWTILNLANNDCKKPVYLNIKVFGEQAVICAKYLDKGRMITAECHLEHCDSKFYQLIGDRISFMDKPSTEKKQIHTDDF